MHILEFIKPDKQFTANEVIQNQITFLLSELYQYKLLVCNSNDEKEVIEHWRNELYAIRSAIEDVLNPKEKNG